jgi:anti-anti-sigma regulatory factor
LPHIVSYDVHSGLLTFSGDEDRTTIGRRRRPLSAAALKATRDIVADLSELRFADPSLMLDFACLAQRLRAQGRTLRLRDPQPRVATLIETVGLHRLPAREGMAAPRPAG